MSEKNKEIRKLSSTLSRLQRENEKTSQTLRDITQQRVQKCIIPPSPESQDNNYIAIQKENECLHALLKDLGYNTKSGMDPRLWMNEMKDTTAHEKESKWEEFAIEESHRADRFTQEYTKQKSYITFLEHRLQGIPGSLEEQYQEERWNMEVMNPSEIFTYLSNHPNNARNMTPYIIEFIL